MRQDRKAEAILVALSVAPVLDQLKYSLLLLLQHLVKKLILLSENLIEKNLIVDICG